ncbi:hypothetical protein TH61_05695 [Rufibacter sp. DG15C]|uniref:hypothetical protein n=1 Tax=Rufibacter sp. DG15C TaxID=1379909 RepID=UPI00078D739A|nr:hypothetical protein [Rufibacter sp. DG15C]AMM50775.1 hypothetical protein TH61_05695 [Rufibacter sp. DG15C]
MKSLFTNKVWALLALCCLTLASCGDDEDEEVSIQSCVLDQVEFFENNISDGSTLKVEYNSQGYVTKATEREGTAVVGTRTFEYNSQNQLVKEVFSEDGGDYEGYTTYEYSSAGTLSKMTRYLDGVLESTETFTYDGSKRLTESRETYMGDVYRTTYSYVGSSQNIAMEMYYDSQGDAAGMTTYEDYDDKLNPYLSIKGVVSPGESRNNPRKATYTYGSSSEVNNYAYKYNASGFVTEIVSKTPNGQTEYKTMFSYAGCQ